MFQGTKKISVVPGKINIVIDEDVKFLNYFLFGEIVTRVGGFGYEFGGEEISVSIKIVPPSLFSLGTGNSTRAFSPHYTMVGEQVYYFYEMSFLKLGLGLEKRGERDFVFLVTPDYWRLVKLKFENLLPVGAHLADLLLVETIRAGNLVLYGGAFLNVETRRASLLMAPSGVGKTYTLLKLIEDPTFRLLSEEVSYLDFSGRHPDFVCVPNTACGARKNSRKRRPADFFSYGRKSLSEVFGPKIFALRGNAKRVYLLENSTSDRLVKAPFDEVVFRKIITLQHLPFTWFSNPLLRARSYYGYADLDQVLKEEESLVRKFLEGVELFIVQAPDYRNFHRLIRAAEKSDPPVVSG